ncbi:MAG: lysophospholipid acyltransferase family protein [Verrucomicrobiae bacterium]|nr:lysophospholipid acyltransferase family protein [Verrucomicrobiae bacterium]
MSLAARAVPPDSPRLRALFAAYAGWYVSRHFHAVRISKASPPPIHDTPAPLVVFLNHASWWDPLICLLLWARWFPDRRPFAPIDAAALTRYRFFERLGFFGVEGGSPRGAATFLRRSVSLLQQPGTMLWVTPQGRFSDARERPLAFRPGLGHLATRCSRQPAPFPSPPPATGHVLSLVPLAIEYTWWHERLPEVLVRFGPPVVLPPDQKRDPELCSAACESALEVTMDALAQDARDRRPEAFVPLLSGRAGIGPGYDTWRRLRAWSKGRPFDARHGTL